MTLVTLAQPGPVTRFFSSDGRTSWLRFVLVLAAATAIGWAGIAPLEVGYTTTYLAVFTLWGIAAAKLAVEAVRRLHDYGQSGRFGVLVAGVAGAVLAATALEAMRSDSPTMTLIVIALVAAGLIVVLFRPGTRGDNAYGPPCPGPLRPSLPTAERHRPRSITVALAFTLTGTAIGYGLISLSEGIRASNERNADWAAAHRPSMDDDPMDEEWNAQSRPSSSTRVRDRSLPLDGRVPSAGRRP